MRGLSVLLRVALAIVLLTIGVSAQTSPAQRPNAGVETPRNYQDLSDQELMDLLDESRDRNRLLLSLRFPPKLIEDAGQDDDSAQLLLGISYSIGTNSVPKDYAQAAKWYREGGERGNAEAQYRLADLYWRGRGVAKDVLRAAGWYRQAAEQGYAEAEYMLGIAYMTGSGVSPNYREGVKWFRMAADQDNARAQAALGIAYLKGQGVPEDNVLAYMWLNLAVSQGSVALRGSSVAASMTKDLLTRTLTRDEIAEAQRLAREWKPVKRN